MSEYNSYYEDRRAGPNTPMSVTLPFLVFNNKTQQNQETIQTTVNIEMLAFFFKIIEHDLHRLNHKSQHLVRLSIMTAGKRAETCKWTLRKQQYQLGHILPRLAQAEGCEHLASVS